MINKINKWGVATLTIVTIFSNVGCSDDFLEEKKLYGTYSETTVYSNYETAKSRIDQLYNLMLPGAKEGKGSGAQLISMGSDDEWAKTTEEYAGLTKWEDNLQELTYNDPEDHFYVENKETSPYGYIREINEMIESLNRCSLPENQKNEFLGQAYFFRAWRYYTMVRWYGGIPIIDHVQEALVGNGEGLNLVVPRASTKECIDFMCEDLSKAATLLPLNWENEAKDWGRVTAGAALALKGRILNLFASPLFNRANKIERWEAAYKANKAAIDTLTEGGYGLAYEGNPGNETQSAANWAKIFLNTQGSDGTVKEAIFVTLYNNTTSYSKWNGWEQSIRPGNAFGGGGKSPTAEIVDLFPMADGMKPGVSPIGYDKLCFFMNRDPRFYRTFAFPGVRWEFDGNPKTDLADSKNDIAFGENGVNGTYNSDYPYNGSDYILWSYTYYKDVDSRTDLTKNGYGSDGFKTMKGKSSVFIRKRSDEKSIIGGAASSFYQWHPTDAGGKGFSNSSAPYMEIRFAEVLLNYAEAAAATGRNEEAIEALKRIRSRVYDAKYAETNYGLNANMTGGELMAAILYERQIELAYEGKRFEDMRRWMLFDGGIGKVEGATENWNLTGWGGNTCTYLGVQPANERVKHHLIEICTKDFATEEDFKFDPILSQIDRNKVYEGMNLSDRLKNNKRGQDQLKLFYETYFERKDKNGEGNNELQIPSWDPKYYIMGLNNSSMVNNPTLYQTIGWEDVMHGGIGIYDPLEDDPAKIKVDTDTGYKR